MLGGCGERRTLIHCWWECKIEQQLWKTVWKFLKNLKVELLYDPAISLLNRYPKEGKLVYQGDTCIPIFITAIIHNSQDMEIMCESVV